MHHGNHASFDSARSFGIACFHAFNFLVEINFNLIPKYIDDGLKDQKLSK